MHKASTSPYCCPEIEPLPEDIKCFLPDICCDLSRIYCKHKHAFTRNRRIQKLAEPKYNTRRYIANCPCRFRKPIQIIRLYERMHTRTELLSLPAVRKLLLFKKRVRGLFPPDRMAIINKHLRKSLFSLYSRLQNVQPPQKPEPIVKWDKKEWKQHTKYLKKLAEPKKALPMPKIPRRCMELKKMKRFKKLAKPKQREEFEKPKWLFTPDMKFYKPTDRILNLAKPKMRDDEALIQSLPIQVPPNALKYKASSRIKELATAQERRAGEPEIRENAFVIAPNALKAKASKRVVELAEPKEYENKHIRDNPNFISPAALTAKASPRICQLAEPKKH